jgi:hypothetical protein
MQLQHLLLLGHHQPPKDSFQQLQLLLGTAQFL